MAQTRDLSREFMLGVGLSCIVWGMGSGLVLFMWREGRSPAHGSRGAFTWHEVGAYAVPAGNGAGTALAASAGGVCTWGGGSTWPLHMATAMRSTGPVTSVAWGPGSWTALA